MVTPNIDKKLTRLTQQLFGGEIFDAEDLAYRFASKADDIRDVSSQIMGLLNMKSEFSSKSQIVFPTIIWRKYNPNLNIAKDKVFNAIRLPTKVTGGIIVKRDNALLEDSRAITEQDLEKFFDMNTRTNKIIQINPVYRIPIIKDDLAIPHMHAKTRLLAPVIAVVCHEMVHLDQLITKRFEFDKKYFQMMAKSSNGNLDLKNDNNFKIYFGNSNEIEAFAIQHSVELNLRGESRVEPYYDKLATLYPKNINKEKVEKFKSLYTDILELLK